MKPFPVSLLPLLALLPLLLAAPVAAGDEPAPPAAPAVAPGPDRAALALPDEVWNRVLQAVARPGGRIGYSAEDMARYGGDQHLIRSLLALFADPRQVPRETGRVTDGLLENADRPAEVVLRGFGLAGIAAGRMLEAPEEEGEATLPGVDPARWDPLPHRVRRLIARLHRAVAAAEPWVGLAFDDGFLAARRQGPAWKVEDLYPLAHAPWTDGENDQAATLSRFALEAIGRTDRAYLAYAAAVLLTRVKAALDEYAKAPPDGDVPADFPGFSLDAGDLPVRVHGPAADEVEDAPAALTVDLGGNDSWRGRTGASLGPTLPISLHVDLGGDDTYASDEPAAVACGLFGIGVVIDLAGDDDYRVAESGLGCAWHGVGLLVDHAGDDLYRTERAWGQGVAHVGVGALVDLAGNDAYECAEQSQGMGSTLGAGILLDLGGDDRYVARDDGNVSALYLDQSVAMSQGCGFGRRADIGDGHSLAGGVGVLLDGGGNDVYHAMVWAQGAGYWWGLGILEDRGGDDVYENGKYSAGAAAHFAIGACVDLAGNDRHNQGSETAVNQYQGHARDGSVGVFVDGDGDDVYLFRNHCGGSADLGSVGLFWDRRGNDRYVYRPSDLGPPNDWSATGPMGTATRYAPHRSFRDDLDSWGIFLDTGGSDVYEALSAAEGIEFLPADGTDWVHHAGPRSWGVGFDVEPAAPPDTGR